MKTSYSTITKISIHAAGTVLGGGLLAWLLGMLGAKLGLTLDPTGWKQLGFAVVGMVVGATIGTYLVALALGRIMQMHGSWVGGLLGTVVGAAALFSAMRVASATPIVTILAVGSLFTCILIGYHAPWRNAN